MEKSVYWNSFFGLSCKIPKGMQSQIELLENLRVSPALKNKSFLDAMEAEYRRRGVLLYSARTEDAAKTMEVLRQPVWDLAHPPPMAVYFRFTGAFRVEASPISDSVDVGGVSEAAESSAARIRATYPGVVVAQPTRVVVNGKEFVRVDASMPSPHGKSKSLWLASDFVTLQKGYRLEFVFAAESERDLQRLVRTMETVHLQSP